MEKDEVNARWDADEEDLTEVAALIRPLPDNVVPSEEFLRRTRMRLLEQDDSEDVSGQRAA